MVGCVVRTNAFEVIFRVIYYLFDVELLILKGAQKILRICCIATTTTTVYRGMGLYEEDIFLVVVVAVEE